MNAVRYTGTNSSGHDVQRFARDKGAETFCLCGAECCGNNTGILLSVGDTSWIVKEKDWVVDDGALVVLSDADYRLKYTGRNR